jgi:hypothetical protein
MAVLRYALVMTQATVQNSALKLILVSLEAPVMPTINVYSLILKSVFPTAMDRVFAKIDVRIRLI